tara:strand:+ start:1101 stop:1862 length:762 start_codon:yes stop_codon:yes gene_type:complete
MVRKTKKKLHRKIIWMNLLPVLINQGSEVDLEYYSDTSKSGGYYLILSLFILLLSFFILLNSISTRTEVKSRAVMDSLLSTFRTTGQSALTAETPFPHLGATPEPGELVDEMRRLWVTEFPVAEIEVFTDGQAMRLRLPANMIFPGGRALLRKDRRRLLLDVAQVLAVETPELSNELELLVSTDWRVGKELDLEANNLEIARAVEFVEELIANGAPRETVSIGIREGDGKELEFRFFVRRKASVRIEFEQYSE